MGNADFADRADEADLNKFVSSAKTRSIRKIRVAHSDVGLKFIGGPIARRAAP